MEMVLVLLLLSPWRLVAGKAVDPKALDKTTVLRVTVRVTAGLALLSLSPCLLAPVLLTPALLAQASPAQAVDLRAMVPKVTVHPTSPAMAKAPDRAVVLRVMDKAMTDLAQLLPSPSLLALDLLAQAVDLRAMVLRAMAHQTLALVPS